MALRNGINRLTINARLPYEVLTARICFNAYRGRNYLRNINRIIRITRRVTTLEDRSISTDFINRRTYGVTKYLCRLNGYLILANNR